MLLSHNHRFIFTKTVKTAGTSVEIYFEPYCMGKGEWEGKHGREQYESDHGIVGYRGGGSERRKWWAHMPAVAIRNLLEPEVWNSYFKFTVVRNPFDKLVSAWYHFKEPGSSVLQKTLIYLREPSLGALRGRGRFDIPTFRKWIRDGGKISDRDKYLIDGAVCVDFFIRYEALIEDLQKVCEILAIPYEPEKLGSFKKGRRDHLIRWPEYYDEETERIVAEEYAWELEKFGYPLPSSM